MVNIAQYPQLQLVAWNRDRDALIAEEDALGLYESNWRHIDLEAMTAEEHAFLNTLVAQYGNGVLNV